MESMNTTKCEDCKYFNLENEICTLLGEVEGKAIRQTQRKCYFFTGECEKCKSCMGIYRDSGAVDCKWYDEPVYVEGCGAHWKKQKCKV